jgi:hypothetical protein
LKSATASYQSYKYGSNGIHNSCHQDTFLEVTYHSFKRHFRCLSENDIGEGLQLLLNAFLLREQGKFHESKMIFGNGSEITHLMGIHIMHMEKRHLSILL